jgi:hypothetical protein
VKDKRFLPRWKNIPPQSLETLWSHFVLTTTLLYTAAEIYFKSDNIFKIVIFVHSIWNNKRFY